MKKTFSFLASFAIVICSWAQTGNYEEITLHYLTNASFEVDNIASLTPVTQNADGLRGYTLSNPNGWSVSGTDVTKLLITKECYTDNNFGVVTTISDGEKAYYLRMGWSNGSTSVTQTIKNLPAGKYLFTIDHRTGYANSASSSFSMKAGNETVAESFVQGSNGFFATVKWTTSTLTFETFKDGDVGIEYL